MSPSKSPSKTKKAAPVTKVLETLAAHNPNAHCELYYETPYQLLVSVVLSAQTTDKMVNRCMEPLYKKGLTPQEVLSMGEAAFLTNIRSIGLAPTKAKRVQELTKRLVSEYGGDVPGEREILESLPGVGRKTANVILGEIFKQPTMAVDTHVFRVSYRLGWQTAKDPGKAELKLLEIIPAHFLPLAHHLLILHGRYTCKAIRPACETCVIASYCPKLGVKASPKKKGT